MYAINTGISANDGSGDTIRDAFWKVNQNFTELYGTVITETGASRTLTGSDAYAYIRCTHVSGCAITVPPMSNVTWDTGVEIYFRVAGAGAPSIVTGTGVTVNNLSGALTLTQHQNWALKMISGDVWDFI